MNYQVKPIGTLCEATGEKLIPGSACHSVLLEREGKVIRLDYAEESWTGAPESCIASWRTIVPAADDSKPRPLDPDALFRCFEQMTEDANPAQEKLRYVLALLLTQKRRLKIDHTRQTDENDILELIGSQGEGPFEVQDQDLTADEMQQLQTDLNGQMYG